MFVDKELRSKRSGRDDENPQMARARMANKRTVYTSSMPTAVVPVERPAPAFIVSDRARVVAIVDRWNARAGFGFALSPDPVAVYFVHSRDLVFDADLMTPGLTIEFTPDDPIPHGARRTVPARPEARHVTIATEPFATPIETTVHSANPYTGNGFLDNPAGARRIYFPFKKLAVNAPQAGDRVRAWIFETPKGLRAVGVERLA